MRIPLYQVDAFTSRLFSGNPAAVCPLPEWLPERTMQAIAAENNLGETAFFVPERDGYLLRWFYADRGGRPLRSCDARFGLCGDPYSGAGAALGDVRHAEGRAARGDTRRRSAGDEFPGVAAGAASKPIRISSRRWVLRQRRALLHAAAPSPS